MSRAQPLPQSPTVGYGAPARHRPAPRGRGLRITPTKRNKDLVRVCAFGLITITLSSVQMYLGPVRLLRPGILLLAIPFAAILMNPRLARWQNLTATWLGKAIAALFVIICMSGVFGLSVGTTVRLLREMYIVNMALFILLLISIRDVRDLVVLMWGYACGVGILIVLSFTVLGSDVTQDGLARLSGGAGMFDANDLGMLALITLPMALLFFHTSGKIGKLVSIGLLAGTPAMIALTGSRGAMVGLAVVGPAILVSMKQVSVGKRLGLAIGVMAALTVAAPAGYWDQMKTILNPAEDYNLSSEYGRWPLVQRGVGYMFRYPVFGVGAGNFARAEGTISPIIDRRLAQGLSVEWVAPHNTYIEVGAELGLIAFSIWLSILYTGTIGLLRLRKRIPASWEKQSAERRFLRQACLYMPLSFLAFAVTSFFLSHTYTAVIYILIAFLAGLLLLIERERKADRMAMRQAAMARSAGAAAR